jgi:hypothetical protein
MFYITPNLSSLMSSHKNNDNKILSFIYKIEDIKNAVNCILENGAYSDRNFESQMSKKSKNYNPIEKEIVELGYRYKKFIGVKLQHEILDYLQGDDEFIEYVKINDLDLYNRIQEILCHAM